MNRTKEFSDATQAGFSSLMALTEKAVSQVSQPFLTILAKNEKRSTAPLPRKTSAGQWPTYRCGGCRNPQESTPEIPAFTAASFDNLALARNVLIARASEDSHLHDDQSNASTAALVGSCACAQGRTKWPKAYSLLATGPFIDNYRRMTGELNDTNILRLICMVNL